jgi:hypothetical protein
MAAWEFLEFMKLFLKENSVELVHGTVDRVHGPRFTEPTKPINEDRPILDLRSRLKC